jgi:hypothetical protein
MFYHTFIEVFDVSGNFSQYRKKFSSDSIYGKISTVISGTSGSGSTTIYSLFKNFYYWLFWLWLY